MANLKDLSKSEELFTGGHRACTGCGAVINEAYMNTGVQRSGATPSRISPK